MQALALFVAVIYKKLIIIEIIEITANMRLGVLWFFR